MEITLNDIMDFHHVIRVVNGKISDNVPHDREYWAPELHWYDDTHVFQPYLDFCGWELMNGYSGQCGYSGPIMHESEYIGGRMERDIIARDGYYVALPCDTMPDGEDEESEPVGWAVAYRPLREPSIA